MKHDGIQGFFTSFIVGALNLVAFSVYFIGVSAQQKGTEVVTIAGDLLRSLEPFFLILGIIFPLVAVLLGEVIDAMGHLFIDKIYERRAGEVLKKDRLEALAKLLEGHGLGNGLDTLTAARAIFFAHAPEHLVNLHQKQWDFYEVYRNLTISLVVHLIVMPFTILNLNTVGVAAWLAVALFCGLFIVALSFGIRGYRGIEAHFATGWLYSKSLEGAESGGRTVNQSNRPQNRGLQRTPGLAQPPLRP